MENVVFPYVPTSAPIYVPTESVILPTETPTETPTEEPTESPTESPTTFPATTAPVYENWFSKNWWWVLVIVLVVIALLVYLIVRKTDEHIAKTVEENKILAQIMQDRYHKNVINNIPSMK